MSLKGQFPTFSQRITHRQVRLPGRTNLLQLLLPLCLGINELARCHRGVTREPATNVSVFTLDQASGALAVIGATTIPGNFGVSFIAVTH
jgi:hypothetical protein